MRKIVLYVLVAGVPTLALTTLILHGHSSPDANSQQAASDAITPVSNSQPAEKSVSTIGPEFSLGEYKHEGISIECSLARITGVERPGNDLLEGDDVRVRIRVSDVSRTPLRS